MADFFDTLSTHTQTLRATVGWATQSLHDFRQRLESILAQDYRDITIRDTAFQQEFTQFCTVLRQDMDQHLTHWHKLREEARKREDTAAPLQAKSFSMWAKTFSRACDEFTSAFDAFNLIYKKYTLTKLPVWVLTACCDDINALSGKILFLSREINKKAGIK